jgi:hypothetical protein
MIRMILQLVREQFTDHVRQTEARDGSLAVGASSVGNSAFSALIRERE